MMFANLVLILLASCQVEAFFQAFRPVVSVRRKLFMTNSEAASTALLKVPAAAWRWPNSWPFAEDVFNPSTTVNPRDLSVEEERGKHFREKIWNYFQSEHKLQGNILLIDENIEDHHNLENVSLQKEVKLHSKYDYSDELFDAIIVLTGFDASSKPRDDFRELWRVLKPGGTCNVVFYGGTNQTSDQQPVKLWSTTNDEQKIWISGAFMQYAVQGGWNQIEAYDVSGVTGNETMSFQKASDADLPIFLIRGTKFDLAPVSSASTADEIAAYIEKKIIILSNMDELEKKLMSMRLASQLIHENTQIETVSWTPILQKLESIFTVLKEVKDNVIPRPAKTLLGFLLLKEWNYQPTQIEALKMSVGQLPPSEEFWKPLGSATANLPPQDKLYFLADIIGQFGREGFSQMKYDRLPSLFNEVLEIVNAKLPQATPSQREKLVADLVLSEYWMSQKDLPNQDGRLIKYVQGSTTDKLNLLIHDRNDA